MTTILGAGLAGLSTAYHLGADSLIFEKHDHSGGHVHSTKINGFTWDEGPHVSFTKYDYVKKLFEESVNGKFRDFAVFPTNYYKGNWVPHPAQTNLYALPEPIRTDCLKSFLQSRSFIDKSRQPSNYQEWLVEAFGEVFANTFPRAYTIKYWTTPPENLSTDWVGERVYYPQVEDVESGYKSAPKTTKHYQTTVRYPEKGGYDAYTRKLKENAKIEFRKEVTRIDLDRRILTFSDGAEHHYERLVNTIALPEFILRSNAPDTIKEAARALSCSELLLVNVVASHPAPRINQWMYVYDLDKYSTRISYTDLFAPENGLPGKSGLQVEVYFSKYRKITESVPQIVNSVCKELVEMGLISDLANVEEVNTKWIPYANVIFDHPRRAALEEIYNYLGKYGLKRESQDLDAMTDWNKKLEQPEELGDLMMAGRFGEWKYYWTDDCVMRGLHISKCLGK